MKFMLKRPIQELFATKSHEIYSYEGGVRMFRSWYNNNYHQYSLLTEW